MLKLNAMFLKLSTLLLVSINPSIATSGVEQYYEEDDVFETNHGRFLLSYGRADNVSLYQPFNAVWVEFLDKRACDNYAEVLSYSLADLEGDLGRLFNRINLEYLHFIYPKEITVDAIEKLDISDSINREKLPALLKVHLMRACGNRINVIKTVIF